jgi:predicted Zn-dependent protease
MKSGDELTPYTYAQENIRTSFLSYTLQYIGHNDANANKLFEQALNSVGELVKNEPLEPRDDLALVQSFVYLAQATHSGQYLQLAENYATKAYNLAPKRQDVRVQLAYTLAQEGKTDEAIKLLKDTVALDPKVGDVHYYLAAILSSLNGDYKEIFNEMELALNSGNFTKLMNGDKINTAVIQVYEQTLKESLANKDMSVFVGSAQRLEQLVPEQKSDLENIINFAQKGMWGSIKLLIK